MGAVRPHRREHGKSPGPERLVVPPGRRRVAEGLPARPGRLDAPRRGVRRAPGPRVRAETSPTGLAADCPRGDGAARGDGSPDADGQEGTVGQCARWTTPRLPRP